MTRIRTNCYACGVINLTIDELLLEIHEDGSSGSYSFTCPNCDTDASRPAGHRVIMVLLATGVEYVVVVDGVTEEEIAAFVNGLESVKDHIRVINS